MANTYGATYPKVVMDETVNYPNAQYNIKRITVEEWNDLLHHTHKQSQIVDEDGNFLGASGSLDGSPDSNINAESLSELIERIQTLEEQNTALVSRIAALESANKSDGVTIGDWDVEEPGIQGPPSGIEDNGEEIHD